jgi:transcription initiation factor TFIID subunit 6
MSIIQPDSIKAIAHSIDLPRLSDEAAKTLAPDVEYRLREVVQVSLQQCRSYYDRDCIAQEEPIESHCC